MPLRVPNSVVAVVKGKSTPLPTITYDLARITAHTIVRSNADYPVVTRPHQMRSAFPPEARRTPFDGSQADGSLHASERARTRPAYNP